MIKQAFPDTYSVPVKIVARRPSSNPRYKQFTQTHFTAGDEEQFEQHYRHVEYRPFPGVPPIDAVAVWPKFALSPEAVRHTFEYMFFKMKKGIFLQIRNGSLVTFLPFSNAFFQNEWSNRIVVPPELEPSDTVLPVHHWYTNNGLFRYENPCNETDTGVCQMKNMFAALCAHYGPALPDVDCFVNRRDFPLMKQDGTEPYHHIYDSESHPLCSRAFPTYAPLLSSCTADGFADLPIPTMDDWTRVQYKQGVHFASTKRQIALSDTFSTPWKKKRELAVFRGTNTGIGLDPATNPRLKLVVDFQHHPRCNVGLTAWNTRPRKCMGDPHVRSPRTDWVTLSGPLTLEEQSTYKYIIHVEGHVQAYRLSMELATRSVILLVQSRYRLWFEPMLEPWVHYVPVASDLSDLDARIQWCLEHDDECQAIAGRARLFYEQYLSRDGCLSYLKTLLEQVASRCDRRAPRRLPNLKQPWIQPLECAPALYPKRVLFRNPNTTIHLVTDPNGRPYVQKQAHRGGARYDHEFFVGRYGVNPLTQRVPNFVYTYAITRTRGLYLEYVPGETLFDYIRSARFQLNHWYFIILQTFLATGVGQRQCFFTHHDLCPWNIVLSPLDRLITVDYLLDPEHVYRVHTQCTPVILDYDKAHIVFQLQHYQHYFEFEPYQDVICLLVSSLYNIFKYQRLSQAEQQELLFVFTESLCDPVYCPREHIRTVNDMVRFLERAHRYAHITFFPKGELRDRSIAHVVALFQQLHQPTNERCEPCERVQYRFLRGVRIADVQCLAQTIDRDHPPLLARHWKQWFHAFLPDTQANLSSLSNLSNLSSLSNIRLTELPDTFEPHSILLVSPQYLDLLNLIVDMYCDGGPYALHGAERDPLHAWIAREPELRKRILAYARHLTKIKLTRNIL